MSGRKDKKRYFEAHEQDNDFMWTESGQSMTFREYNGSVGEEERLGGEKEGR